MKWIDKYIYLYSPINCLVYPVLNKCCFWKPIKRKSLIKFLHIDSTKYNIKGNPTPTYTYVFIALYIVYFVNNIIRARDVYLNGSIVTNCTIRYAISHVLYPLQRWLYRFVAIRATFPLSQPHVSMSLCTENISFYFLYLHCIVYLYT